MNQPFLIPHQLLTDNDFNGRILKALKSNEPLLNVVRVQDNGLEAASDPVILEWQRNAIAYC
jgi:hypothetical protein